MQAPADRSSASRSPLLCSRRRAPAIAARSRAREPSSSRSVRSSSELEPGYSPLSVLQPVRSGRSPAAMDRTTPIGHLSAVVR